MPTQTPIPLKNFKRSIAPPSFVGSVREYNDAQMMYQQCGYSDDTPSFIIDAFEDDDNTDHHLTQNLRL